MLLGCFEADSVLTNVEVWDSNWLFDDKLRVAFFEIPNDLENGTVVSSGVTIKFRWQRCSGEARFSVCKPKKVGVSCIVPSFTRPTSTSPDTAIATTSATTNTISAHRNKTGTKTIMVPVVRIHTTPLILTTKTWQRFSNFFSNPQPSAFRYLKKIIVCMLRFTCAALSTLII